MVGRKPKHLEMKLLQGNPGKGPLAGSSGHAFVSGPIAKPKGLDTLESQEWDRLTRECAPILSPAFSGIVLVAARNYGRMRTADMEVAREGETYVTTGKNGAQMIRENPYVSIGDRACIMYHRALAELGATPVGRTRVHTLPDAAATKPTDLDELLG